jgi:hypothetical protein
MDQLKPVIDFCKKQYFWILLGIVSALSITGFVLTKMSLATQLDTQKKLVDSKYSVVQEVSGKASTHPNENSHKEMDRIVGVIAEDVRKAWELQYMRQVKIMQWPNSLGQDFVAQVDKYRPIELLPFPVTDEKIGLPYRERYRDYVDPLFPKLAKIIGANWEVTTDDIVGGAAAGPGGSGGLGAPSGGGGRGIGGPGGLDPGDMLGGSGGIGGPTGKDVPKSLVYWQPTSQKELMQSVLWWHDKKRAPSTLEILYTQEDLWIIEGLMNIIKATNGDAQENFQAAIKEIEFLRIGKNAVGRAGVLTSLGSSGNMGMGGMGSGSSGMPMPGSGDDGGGQMDMGSSGGSPPAPGAEGMEGMLDGAEGGAGAPAAPDPASGRYVDIAFQPINGDTLRSVVSGGSVDGTSAPLAVAKRVPVRMRFKMDQRKLNRLLTECGNADLLLEIRQVRINTDPHGNADLGGMMGGGGRPGPQMGGMAGLPGLGSPDGGMEGSGSGGGTGPAIVGTSKSYDLPVEVYGIVYLFNPVDMNKLGIEKVTAETQIENVGRVSAAESTGLETDQSASAEEGAPASAPAAPQPGNVPPGNGAAGNGAAGNGAAGNGAAGNGAAGNGAAGNGAVPPADNSGGAAVPPASPAVPDATGANPNGVDPAAAGPAAAAGTGGGN